MADSAGAGMGEVAGARGGAGVGVMAVCPARLGGARICADGLGDVAVSAAAFGDPPSARLVGATVASTSAHTAPTLSRRPDKHGYRVRAVGDKSVPS
ncbi:MAG TPA: hypothetical protein VGP18_07785 [Solirubrobacteraceae bacterium]|nr:hypothetical protein [Solirubrobacteraceae bacterium]